MKNLRFHRVFRYLPWSDPGGPVARFSVDPVDQARYPSFGVVKPGRPV